VLVGVTVAATKDIQSPVHNPELTERSSVVPSNEILTDPVVAQGLAAQRSEGVWNRKIRLRSLPG
jgi:hypothetical protein